MTASYSELGLFVDGEWIRSGRSTAAVMNPATEERLADLPLADPGDLDRACDAARRGFEIWSQIPAEQRGDLLCKAAALLRERAAEIAPVLTREHGKPLLESRGEVLRSAAFIEWNAHEGRRAYGRIIPGAPGFRQMVLKKPVGPVAAFTPWNFPLLAPAAKIGAALAAGCSIVIKASEETPGGAVELVRCLQQAGVPAGVVNLVFGDPATVSRQLIEAPQIRLITLTGSIPVGMQLAEHAARQMKPAIMELGGHAPVIVCHDTDPVAAARNVALGKFRNSGQVCVSPTRFIVHEAVYELFIATLAAVAGSLKLGDGMLEATQMGPLANARRVQAMEALVADAVARGARVVTGGKRHGDRGHFFEPTVLGEVPRDARVMQEEPFGPLAPVLRFRDLDDAIALANALPFGLAAYAFTESTSLAAALADRIECGILSINHPMGGVPEAPFGGVKQSGYGREGGSEGLDCYLVTRFVSQRASVGG